MKKILTSVILGFVVLSMFSLITPKATIRADSTDLMPALNGWSVHPMFETFGSASDTPTGLSPTQIRAAYNLPSTGGQGTIAIVDAYDDPTVLNDLNVFSGQFGLPLLNSTNFEKHMMMPTISVNSSWAFETSLDVQWAHAIAPNAKILLVEALDDGEDNVFAAVDYARNRRDVVAISMSWGSLEFAEESSYDSYFTSPYGASFFASSGDNAENVSYPACSPNVVGVGGTTLTFAANGSVASETAWRGSGGGVSEYETEPSYQVLYGVPDANGHRSVPDVSYDANPNSGVSIYDSTPIGGQSGWFVVGGTSAGAPQWAAIQSIGLTASNNNFYRVAQSIYYHSYFRDITSGTNGKYSAMPGYDHVTGLGSPLTTTYSTRGLTITATSGGTTNPSPGTYTYPPGTVVAVTASPDTGYLLDHWELDGTNVGATNPMTVTMDTNHALHAVFLSHDVAVTNVTPSKTFVGQGYNTNIMVTVANEGGYTETFNVTVYANTTAIGTPQTVSNLLSKTSTVLNFTWNTTGFAYGNYTISAYAWPVPYETHTSDNTIINGTVYVGIPGDVDADGKVDMKDISYVARRFGCKLGSTLWDPNADFNNDGKIDMRDIAIVAKNFGKHYP